ncbi:MAG TPA: PCYCGC motif-containing (lipo)protein, partial [Candidatus Limnocylindrales bacterium]|nr:PCYCGC motif-containing (lipo)protein [Candidatus Limnocylindrales bacterium]
VSAAWAARPDFVKALPSDWQGAYSFALARPDVLQWIPCYCGCTGIEHRSNLDCFFVRREVKGTFQYEEHASYCDICVKTANLAQQMLREGASMVQIRAAVDAQFGGGAAPGTDTPMPPA